MKRAVILLVDNLVGLAVLAACAFGIWKAFSALLALAIALLLTVVSVALLALALGVVVYLIFQFQMPKEN